jgi:predicted phosphodiesterase
MLVQFVSDIHLELGPRQLPRVPGARVLVIAGDLGKPFDPTYETFLRSLSDYERVFLVAGNHEFWSSGKTVDKIEAKLARLQSVSNVYYLSHRTPAITFEDVTFVGATLWSDVPVSPEPGAFVLGQVGDYKQIKLRRPGASRKTCITTAEVAEWHKRDVQYLTDATSKIADASKITGASTKLVVATHHAPSFRSSLRFDEFSRAYYSNLDSLVEQSGAKFWIHGHTHKAVHYRIGGTSVVSAPMGYPGELGDYAPAAIEI